MMKTAHLVPLCLLVLLASACQPGLIPTTTSAAPAPTHTSTSPETSFPQNPDEPTAPAVLASATPQSEAMATTLRLWLPPQFDPNGTLPAASLLKQRLDQYSEAHPEVVLEVRIKGSGDPGSVLEALSLTRSAAPGALPDLVALPHAELEAAAIKGALHSPDGLAQMLADPDWYPYARQAGHVQNTPYGLPFAGDTLAIAYHPSQFEHLPTRWEELFVAQKALAVYADDPESLLLLSLYLSTGTPLLDANNKPFIDPEALARVLKMVQKGRIVPLQSEEAVWTAFVDRRVQLAVVWSSTSLQQPLKDTQLMPLLTPAETPFTLASTWNWALAGSDPQNDPAALELAAWLSQPDFMAAWDQAAGYLSPRPTGLKIWDEKAALDMLSQPAVVIPSRDVVAAFGPVLGDALARTLNGEPPEVVAEAAAEALK